MILRIVLGGFASGFDIDALVASRDQLLRSARAVHGLESVIVGIRSGDAGSGDAPGDDPEPDELGDPAAIVTVWRDVESMRRATTDHGEDLLVATRLELPFRLAGTHHFELVDRAFGGLPPVAAALLRIVTIRARVNEEARLLEILRGRQPRMIDRGLVASQLARRVIAGGEVEAIVTGLWPDRSTVQEASGRPGITVLPDAEDLADWSDRLTITAFDALEIVPRLPVLSGPPLFILDEQLRIVDITPSAAAVLGMPAEDIVSKRVEELSLSPPEVRAATWERLLEEGSVEAEAAWRVSDIGTIQLRFVARKDVPIPGRHAVYVRRRLEPPPTHEDLDAAIAETFGPPIRP